MKVTTHFFICKWRVCFSNDAFTSSWHVVIWFVQWLHQQNVTCCSHKIRLVLSSWYLIVTYLKLNVHVHYLHVVWSLFLSCHRTHKNRCSFLFVAYIAVGAAGGDAGVCVWAGVSDEEEVCLLCLSSGVLGVWTESDVDLGLEVLGCSVSLV